MTDILIALAAMCIACSGLGLATIGAVEWKKAEPDKLLLFVKQPWFKVILLCVFVGVWVAARVLVQHSQLYITLLLIFASVFTLSSFIFWKVYVTRLNRLVHENINKAESVLQTLSDGPLLVDPKLDEQVLRIRMQLVEAKTQASNETRDRSYDVTAAFKKARTEAIFTGCAWAVLRCMYDQWIVHRLDIWFEILFGILTGLILYGMSSVQILIKKRALRKSSINENDSPTE